MIKNYLEIGQIVSTHGIRGEVRINPWCNGPEFVKKFKTLYKDANGKDFFKVVSCRPHKNVAIAKLEGVDTVEMAQGLSPGVLSFHDLIKSHFYVRSSFPCRNSSEVAMKEYLVVP